MTNAVGTGIKDAGSAAAGTALGALRIGEGFAQAVPATANLAVHAITKPVRMIAGPDSGVTQELNSVNQQSQRITNDVSDPINWLAAKTDQAAQAFGQPGADIYKPAQIAGNIATILPGAAAAATKLPVVGEDIARTASRIPGISIGKAAEGAAGADTAGVAEEAAPATVESAPTETGIKGPEEVKPTNAPSGGTPEPVTTPNAPESGVKPVEPPTPNVAPVPTTVPATVARPQAVGTPPDVAAEQNAAQQAVDKTAETPPSSEPAPVAATPAITPNEVASEATAASPQQQVVNEVPNVPQKRLEKTGNVQTDLENAAQAVHDRIENPADFTGNAKAQDIIDQVNGRQQGNSVVAKEFADRLDAVLTKEQQLNVQDALQSGTVDQLTGDEKAVAEILQQHLHNPADVLRAATDKDYVAGNNYSTQIRAGGGIKSAARTANNIGTTLKSKVSNFNDLLQQSRFSQARTLGKFTSGKTTVFGDPGELGLVAKKDGTFVDKAGKVYDYSHATNKELADNAGIKTQGLSNSSHTYATDTMNLKVRSDAANELIKNPEKYGLSDTAIETDQPSVTIKGSDGENHEFFTDKGTQEALQKAGVTTGGIGNKTNLATTLFNKATTGVVQSIVANPLVHSANQLVQGMVASGLRANGLGGASFLKNAFNHGVDDVVAFHDAGGYVPTYGKDIQTVLSKLSFGGSKLNEKAMSAIDGNFRVGAFKSLTKGGMAPKEAAATVNRFMGDRAVFKDAQPQMGMFMHYFVTMNKSAGSTLAQAVKGHPGALANAATAAAITYGLQQQFQKFTGNENASVHAPGIVGIGKDYVKSGEELSKGHFANALNPIVNRINPLITQVAEQILGVNRYGDKFKNGASRAENAAAITPETNAIASNGHSFGEKVLNTFGLYTPHIKGNMATNNPALAPILNVKGAQNGSTVAFPKDFTGEQNSKAVNDYLGNTGTPYSSKTAAQFGSQTQDQQKALIAATKVLRPVGVTNPVDIQKFSKLSGSDQQTYVDVVKSLNAAGTTVNSSAIEKELVSKGNVGLAASLNTSIPTDPPQDQKNALEGYATAGNTGQRNVWLQNNDNADSYYKAAIAKAQATGALTNEDKDTSGTWSGTGNTLAVKALVAQTNKQNNVSQELQQLYEDTTKTQYNNMTGAQKDALTQYANQLNANGVIDKFGIASGTSGGSSKNNLPNGNAVVMPSKGTGLTAGSVKYVAPTLATAKVGASTNNNPFVRSISTSKGVK